MNKNRFNIIFSCILAVLFLSPVPMAAEEEKPAEINVQELVMEHTSDAHEWHITTINGKPVSIPLPVIVKSSQGWRFFMSSKFEESQDGTYNGLYLNHEGKVCEKDASGNEFRVLDLSITKNVVQLWIVVILLIVIFLYCARWYKNKKPQDEAPRGFVGFIEMFVMFVYNDIIK